MENIYMTNHDNLDLYDNEEIYNLEDIRPRGWSVTCLDETIFYYVDCNYVNMCSVNNRDDDNLNKE
uniref:hypothetical protein n=1 Tax=Pulvinaster venetus TaxID=427767 RepID=UPI001FCD0FAB|nr:hypothetical protein MW436_pgp152 [Pulvinaster venetus]UNJ16907.1 hypothetical protein [Pulvinaster venetus]